jgi:NIMA (never in mitosis gene a)-related kinase
MEERDIWNVAIKGLRALKALHKLKIVHRDIKAANIFLSRTGTKGDNAVAAEEYLNSMEVKLGDLNVSKIAKLGLLQTQTGTPYYASPEVWRDQPYNYKCDIWSFGCVLYEIAALRPPFMAKDMKGLFQKVTKGVFPNIPPSYSGDLYFLISRMLTVDPSLRPSADQLLSLQILRKRTSSVPSIVHSNASFLGLPPQTETN